MASSDLPPTETRFGRLLRAQGIHRPIAWGFVALTLFMVGNGLETGFLSPHLDVVGFSTEDVATLWAVYGIVAAAAAWLSGALAEAWGPKRVMLFGFGIWCVCEVVFLGVGVVQQDFLIMLITFAVRGLGYAMFAYGFLVWVAMGTPDEVMGRAVGWYWFFSTLGQGVIGSYLAGAVIPLIGELATLWLSLAFVSVAGLLVLFLLRSPRTDPVTVSGSVRGLVSSVTVVGSHPRVGLGGIVRLINTLSVYAFVVFLTTYMVRDVGFEVAQWQLIWGTMFAANVAANVMSGYLADWVGRVRVVAWGGGVGCFVTVLGLFYVPTTMGPVVGPTTVMAVLYGLALGMFVPLTAIVPLLVPEHRAAAVAVLNLGAGLSQFIGPVVAGLVVHIGVEATVWVIAILYLVGFGLTFALEAQDVDAGDPGP